MLYLCYMHYFGRCSVISVYVKIGFKMTFPKFAFSFVWILLTATTVVGQVSEVFRQSNVVEGASAGDISRFVIANDFLLDSDTDLSAIRIWITDAFNQGDNGVVDNFNGTIGWAIYEDAGNGRPSSTAIASGFDSSPIVTDAGIQTFGGTDVSQLDFQVEATLDAGVYWLGLHEGRGISAPSDGTSIGLLFSRDEFGPSGFGSPSTQTSNLSEPLIWEAGSQPEYSFVLFAAAVPEPTGGVVLAFALIGAGLRRKR